MTENQPGDGQACVSTPKIKHDWYQTETHVIITILLKNAPQDKMKIEFGDQSLSVSCPVPNSQSEYSLEIELAHRIVSEDCAYTVSPSKIEVKLKKRDDIRWTALEGQTRSNGDCVKPIPQAIVDASGPQTSTSTRYPYRKDWNKIENELKKQEEEEQPSGEAALNALFQKIYGEGSDEVRKAMNKSFVESGGTVLSTNWKEVGTDKVDIKPPDGMEWKKWDN